MHSLTLQFALILSSKNLRQKFSKKIFSKPLDNPAKVWYNNQAVREYPKRECAGVAELADARDLKSRDTKVSYRFEPGVRHPLPELNIAG